MENIKNNFIQSIKKNLKGIILMVISALFVSVGQLFWKFSDGSNMKFLLIGFACYGLGALIMVVAFRFGSLSVLHPLMSIGYVFAIILGITQLHENVSVVQYIAVAMIMLGVILIGGGDV